MCTVASAPGTTAFESGRLCHRDHKGGGRCRRVLMLQILMERHPRRGAPSNRSSTAGNPRVCPRGRNRLDRAGVGIIDHDLAKWSARAQRLSRRGL